MQELKYSGYDIRYESKDSDGMLDYAVYFDDIGLINSLGFPFEFSFAPHNSKYPLLNDAASSFAYHLAAAILNQDGFEDVKT